MKNKLYQALLLIFLVAGISSCDYLDIVPDERPTEEDAFKDKNAAERYLYSCYAFMPKEREGCYLYQIAIVAGGDTSEIVVSLRSAPIMTGSFLRGHIPRPI